MLSLLEEKVLELDIVEKASDNTIARTLKKNILKPHLNQQWVIAPQANAGFVANMEECWRSTNDRMIRNVRWCVSTRPPSK